MDIENAFNSLNRQEILAATRALFPSLAPWVDWSYGETSFVRIGDARISSERGVQQGDPLGPLLFSLALHRAVGRVKLRVPAECPGILDFSVAYLDDMFVAGTDDAVAWFCEALSSELESMGLSTSTHKCIVTPSAGSDSLADASCFPGWAWNTTKNIKILGAAVGDEELHRALVKKRRSKAQAILKKLGQLGHVQPALLILRSCASFAKLVHNCRTSPPRYIHEELAAFDSDVKDAFVQFTQLVPDSAIWHRVQRSTGTGGLGLRSSERHAAAAFTASCGLHCQLPADLSRAFRSGRLFGNTFVVSYDQLAAFRVGCCFGAGRHWYFATVFVT